MAFAKPDKLDFRQIVLAHLKTILEISSKELRNNTQTINHGTFSQTTYQEDTRLSYIQSIENFSYILLPYFDKKMQEVYDKCIPFITYFDYEVLEKSKEIYEKVCKETEKKPEKLFILDVRLRNAKELFSNLNLLLHRVDYLKNAVFGENEDETIKEEDE